MFPRGDDRYAEFFNVLDAKPADVAADVAADDDVEVQILREYEDGALFEFLVSNGCPAYNLAQLGTLPREIHSEAGDGRIVVEVPPENDPSEIIERFLAEYPDASLARKREKADVRPLYTRSTFGQILKRRLTDRQREVLSAAFEAGYYEWPRECTGEEVADMLDISSATFSEHIAAAERKLLTVAFEGPE